MVAACWGSGREGWDSCACVGARGLVLCLLCLALRLLCLVMGLLCQLCLVMGLLC